MEVPVPFRHLDAQKLAREGWGTNVDIAEIMRQETQLTLVSFVQNLYTQETLRRTGQPLEQAAETLSRGFRQEGWSDVTVMLCMLFAKNLLRELPVDEFIDKSPVDFLRRFTLQDDGEVPEALIGQCPHEEHDFWYGLLPEGREIAVTADGVMRLCTRVMETQHMTPQQLLKDREMEERLTRTLEKKIKKMTEQAIRAVLAGRIDCQSLLDRDRMIDTVHHVVMDASFKLFTLLKQEGKGA